MRRFRCVLCLDCPLKADNSTLHRCGTTIPAPLQARQSCRFLETDLLFPPLVPLLGGIIWKRGTTKGAAASAAVGMITALLSIFGVITVPFSSIFPVLPGVVAYIVVSLCTKHAPTENTAKVADVVMASTSEKSNNAAN